MEIIIGTKIKELRKNFGLTQNELAEKIGIARSTLSGYEKSTSQPDLETLKRIAAFFSVSTDYLLGLEDNNENDAFFNQLLYFGHQLNAINRTIILGEMASMIKEQNHVVSKKKVSNNSTYK